MQLEKHSLLHNFVRFVSATISSLLVFCLYSIVDGLFISHGVGEYALSAVNLALPFMNLLFAIGVIFAVGSSTIIAIYLGQGKGEKASSLFSQNVALLLCTGLVISVLAFLFLTPFARILGAQGVTLDYTRHYLMGLAPFSVCFILSNSLEVLVKTDGYPRLAIISVVTGCLTNCVLDWVAIFVLGWGTFGAAVATGISQLVTCVIYFSHFLRGHSTFRLVRFKMDWSIYRRLIPLGIPDGMTELFNGVMIFLFNRTILQQIGQDGLVSYTIIAYVNTLVVNLMVGVAQGAQPLVSYQLGRRNLAGCRTLLRYGFCTIAGFTVLCLAGLYLFASPIATIFLGADNAALTNYSVFALRRYLLCYAFLGSNILISGFLTAVEWPQASIILSAGRGLILQAGCLFTLALTFGGDSIWFAPALSEAICLVLSISFLRRFWSKKAAQENHSVKTTSRQSA